MKALRRPELAAGLLTVSALLAAFAIANSPLRPLYELVHHTPIPLSPVRSGEEVLYRGRVRLDAKTRYRILIHATPAGAGRALEAQFDYRHHH